ncbi:MULTISPECIES: hypothetical protein [Bacillaceae]|jgi:hypothetical protein|uniref:Uncharacterized protein n=1 Tax=Niallia hominis TaxID=3133173 RepID=A0ABV1ETI4_9BACI|nr:MULTISPECIES: hypothetical protein [Bacillaceae]MCF2649897.1 hypothetical protein [Niallia circulans]CAI9386414.1 hypothetical protein BACSP_01591 [Bacillus sp. T2.9-1]
MQPTVITGLNGVIYQNFPQPAYGAWNQQLLGNKDNYYYMIGGQLYKIAPRPQGTQAYYPYLGPNVPLNRSKRQWY